MTLQVFTARIDYRDRDTFNVTASSGGAGRGAPFAPSWGLLRPFLEQRAEAGLSDDDWRRYSAAYTREMRVSYRTNRAAWERLLARERVVLVCYCVDPERCHRRLLAQILARLGAEDGGELRALPRQPTLPGLGA